MTHHASLPPDRRACAPEGASARRRGRLKNGTTPGDFLAAARCGARTRAGGCCRQPAMKNGRCRMHGGLSTGPRTAAGRARCAAARRTHGFYSAETMALRRAAAAHCRRMDAFFASVKVRRTAGHGLLPVISSNRAGGQVRRRSSRGMPGAPSASSAPSRLRGDSSGTRDALSAGHGVLPSVSTPALHSVRRPAPRQGFVQRTLLGSTALGLGRTVKPPIPAGHGLLPSFSAAPPQDPARSGVRVSG